jgi:hypothetical protein
VQGIQLPDTKSKCIRLPRARRKYAYPNVHETAYATFKLENFHCRLHFNALYTFTLASFYFFSTFAAEAAGILAEIHQNFRDRFTVAQALAFTKPPGITSLTHYLFGDL